MVTNAAAPDNLYRRSDFVRSLERGLAVVKAFQGDNPSLTVSDVARATGLDRGPARRFLLTLINLGYVRVDERTFALTPRILEVSGSYLSSLRFPELAMPYMRELVAETGESASLAILDGARVVYVAHASAKKILSITITIGSRASAFDTALGRVLLAGHSDEWLDANLNPPLLPLLTPTTVPNPAAWREDLARIRNVGFALVDQRREDLLRSMAVPITNEEQRVVAALDVAVHTRRWTLDTMRSELGPRLLNAASLIAKALAHPTADHDSTIAAREIGHPPHTPSDCNRPEIRDFALVQSLQRGLSVIRAFDRLSPAMTLSEVAKATGLARAAARRFLLTLVALGYMQQEGRRFRPTPQVLELGRPYFARLTLPELSMPHLRDFAKDVREASSVAVLDDTEIVYVAHVPAKRMLSVLVTLGARDPAYATSLGRAILADQSDEWLDCYLSRVRLLPIRPSTVTDATRLRAELALIRARGFAVVDEELEEGLIAIAVPIRDADMRVIGAVNVAAHASRWTVEAMSADLAPRLLSTAAEIERDVRAAGPQFDPDWQSA